MEALRQNSEETRGRKRKHEYTESVRTNWQVPHLWQQIDQAHKDTGKWPDRAKPKYVLADVIRLLHKRNHTAFATLTTQVLGRWLDKPSCPGARPPWKACVLEQVGFNPGGQVTQCGILVWNLCSYKLELISLMWSQEHDPALIAAIIAQLKVLQQTGTPLSLFLI
jgi:hypothetical protein